MLVLFCDDQKESLDIYRDYVKKYESPYLDSIFTESHQSLIETCKNQTPDVVFTDIFPAFRRYSKDWENLDVKDGLEAINIIKSETDQNITFVVVTGSIEFEYAKKAVNVGVNELISKPVSYEVFRNTMLNVEEKRFMEISLTDAWAMNDEKRAFDICATISQMAVSFSSNDLLGFASTFKEWQKMKIAMNPSFFLKHFGSAQALFSDQLLTIENRLKELFSVSKNNVRISQEIISYVNDNIFFSGLCLDMVAGRFGYSVPYLSLLIKNEIGKGFTEYITNKRISKAKELLISTDKTVKEIASDCGFTYSNYFIKVFSHEENLTPAEWRNKNKISS